MAKTLKILIAEDHQTVRDGLKLIVNAQEDMEVVGEAGDGREVIELASKLHPDVVLMDISMPEVNGLTATARLKRTEPDLKILALTRHTDDAYLQEMIEAGISGYVLKQSDSRGLIRAIRTVVKGNYYLDPALAGKVFRSFGDINYALRGELKGKKLSARESETLRYTALGYSNSEIAEKMNISVKTIEAHKANSMKKLNMKCRRDIVSYAILQGWLREN